MVNILYLEPDHLWAEFSVPELEQYGKVQVVKTEHDFRKVVDAAERWPGLFVLEQMVAWTIPAESMPEVPDDVEAGGFREAGVRCYRHLRKAEMARGLEFTPVIMYTIAELDNLPLRLALGLDMGTYEVVNKGKSMDSLHEAVRKLI